MMPMLLEELLPFNQFVYHRMDLSSMNILIPTQLGVRGNHPGTEMALLSYHSRTWTASHLGLMTSLDPGCSVTPWDSRMILMDCSTFRVATASWLASEGLTEKMMRKDLAELMPMDQVSIRSAMLNVRLVKIWRLHQSRMIKMVKWTNCAKNSTKTR